MKSIKSYMLLASVITILYACGPAQIEKPIESYLPSNLSPAMSELPIQIELDIKKLEAAINTKLNGLLYEGSNLNDKDLSVKIWKAQPFIFTINNNIIEYRVPIKVWSRFSWKVQKLGITLSDDYEATGTIALVYKTAISINPNWKLVSKTVSSGYQWLDKPRINIIGVNVPITPIANLTLSYCDEIITKQIDKALSQSIDLKQIVTEVWMSVQKPMLLSPENHLWLKVTPKDIYLTPFTTKGNNLNMAIALFGQVESIVGAEPSSSKFIELPGFHQTNKPPQQFNLNIAADITYEKISEITKSQILNKPFVDGSRSITLTDLSIYSSQGKAVFAADVTGSFKGRIYFTGKMVYNSENKSLEVIDADFDIKTKSFLIKSANWLLHGIILKKIIPYLTYPVTEDLERAKNEANNMLANYSIYGGVSVQGKLNNLVIHDINMIPGAVRIKGNIKGNVSIKISDLSF